MGKKCCGLACSHGLILIIFGMAHVIIILNYLFSPEPWLPDTTFHYTAKLGGEGAGGQRRRLSKIYYNPTGIQ